MTPKIEFEYSWIYDHNWKEWIGFYRKFSTKYPSEKRILRYIEEIKRIWKKEESKILNELPNITKLKWKSKKIVCYVVGRCYPFSNPLTMPIYVRRDWFVDVLTHELVHKLFTQKGNTKRTEEAWKYIYKKYKDEPRNTRMHIPLHAIHTYIYLKFYGKARLMRNIMIMKYHKEYKKAWDIVQKEGYQNIIKEFVGRIK